MFLKTHRSWGWYRVLFWLPWLKIKLLCFYPRMRLSTQMHEHRNEAWFVLPPTCFVMKRYFYHMKAKKWHTAWFEQKTYIIEVQYGRKVSEADIMRM